MWFNKYCAESDEDYPLHGELPFANYQDTYTGIGRDQKGKFLVVGGTYDYRNSQEYHYSYSPQLRLYENSSVAEMHIDIYNHRQSSLDYMFMCHINWLAVEKSRIVYSAIKDRKHIVADPPVLEGTSVRAKRMQEYAKKIIEDPTIADVLDSETQCNDPEMCINIKYESDEDGWAHAMQVMPEGDSCYVRFKTEKLPYALRWICRTGDEDGIGIALPTTGTNRSTKYQKEHHLFNTIGPKEHEELRFDFGYLNMHQTKEVKEHIDDILANSSLEKEA